jgi:hypothetical protein
MFDQFKFNLKTPVDSDAAHRISFTTTVPHIGYSGMNTFNDRVFTNYFPSRSGSLNNEHLSIYKYKHSDIANDPGQADLGGIDFATTTRQGLWATNNGGNQVVYYNGNYTAGTDFSAAYYTGTKTGFYAGTRLNNRMAVYKASQKLDERQVSASSAALMNKNLQFGVYGVTDGSLNHTYAFTTIGNGLTDYEAKALYWIVQKFQTTLGRQVY